MRKYIFGFFSITLLFSCSNLKQSSESRQIPQLKFINSIEIPFNLEFQDTKIGGLSGIDYDKKQDLYYIICDERSQENLSRFYTAKIKISKDKLETIDFTETTTLKNAKGLAFGNWLINPETSADPEDIRLNPKTNSLIWSSEGARVLSTEKNILQNPSITFMDLKGNFSDKPLFEDGNQATTNNGGLIRIYRFNAINKKNTAQYAYKLDAIAREPNPKDAFAVNGVAAIQYYKKNQLLVLERSYSTGTQACTIKVFLCDFKDATDVKNYDTLQNQTINLSSKKLLLNMNDLGIYTDNIEGLTFGPQLANGNRSLLFVSDNNFSSTQKTQVFLFEVQE